MDARADHRFDLSAPHPELDGVDISHLQDTDWTSNTDAFGMFAAQGLAAPKLVSPADVRHEVKERTSNIFSRYSLLQDILQRHEAKIQNRWEKKTNKQRLSILLKAWPDMPATHRPEFAAFRKYPSKLHQAAAEHRGSFMWPYINQEDLAKPKTLPLLLNSRGRNHPNVFAAADGDSMHLGLVSLVMVPVFLNQYVMTLNGMVSKEDYGKLIGWDEDDRAFDWMHSRKQFLPGEGLLILEIQERLLSFLIFCCQQILHDISSAELASNSYAIEPEPPLKSIGDSTGFTNLATMAEEAPYRVPAKLEMQKITSLLAAQASLAEDHIWALREDPGYFTNEVVELRDHQPELLKDIQGNIHPILKPAREELLWTRVVSKMIFQTTSQLENFSELRRQAHKLQALQTKYEADISPLEDLPDEYLDALLKFRYYLDQMAKRPLNQLKIAFAASQPMRTFFVRDVPTSTDSPKINIRLRSVIKLDKTKEHLLWLLRTLWEDGHNLFLCRLPAVVDELERLIKADQNARELISPYIARVIGELSIVAECLRQLDIYQPWANGFEDAFVDKEELIKKQFEHHNKFGNRILKVFRDQNLLGIATVGVSSDKKFDYPMGKRRNKANVEKLRAAETQLDIFWAKIDDLIQVKVGLHGTALQKLLSEPRLLQRTPEWIEPTVKKGDNTKDSYSELSLPFSALLLSPESSSARKEILASEASKKTKSREKSTPTSEHTAAIDLPIETPLDPQPMFQVDARALKVFRMVFFDPNSNTTAGEIAWIDFLHAMSSAGFAAQKLYGSVWHFQPTRLDVERSIQFHEPHPRGKIPFFVARRHGRRLNRAYGWSGGMFIMKEQ